MKINIKGNDITPEKIAEALRICERDHGLKIKGATIYVRFEDNLGRTVEPLQNGCETSRDFCFWKKSPNKTVAPVQNPEPKDPISAKEMIEICQRQAHRVLSSPEMKTLITLAQTTKVESEAFIHALNWSLHKNGKFNMGHLIKTIEQHNKNNDRSQ